MAIMSGPYEPVYKAVARWVDVALRRDDSLFTPGQPVWSLVVADDLERRFVAQPDLSSDTFVVKLRRQLEGAPATTIQLAGEVFYMHLLVADDIYGKTKRDLVNEVLSWASDQRVAIPADLDAALDRGLAASGVAYKTYRYHQIVFFLSFVQAWKHLTYERQQELLDDPWAFKAFLFELPLHAAQSQREALLHFVHPNTFEAIVSRDSKAKIAAAFADLIPDPVEDVDKRLAQIRAALAPKYGADFHFWHPELLPVWNPPAPVQPVAAVTSAASPTSESLAALADSLFLDADYLYRAQQLLLDKGQAIFYGPPGTGKTFVALKLARYLAGPGAVELVQFHPSYAYEDFVEGYRPAAVGGQGFELTPGPLRRIASLAAQQPEAMHVLVIDEVNRGNIPKVFGELYYLLEYRDEEISLQYSREPFSLPANLLIIGTMNTVDRSIALVDLALRRRFYFVPFYPDVPPVKGLLKRWLSANAPDFVWAADVVERANAKLADRDVAIGPSYFMRSNLSEEWIALVWEYSVLPMLAEHFFGDEDRLEDFALDALRGGGAAEQNAGAQATELDARATADPD
jgi:5-methylcytosine-specific restriction protein B